MKHPFLAIVLFIAFCLSCKKKTETSTFFNTTKEPIDSAGYFLGAYNNAVIPDSNRINSFLFHDTINAKWQGYIFEYDTSHRISKIYAADSMTGEKDENRYLELNYYGQNPLASVYNTNFFPPQVDESKIIDFKSTNYRYTTEGLISTITHYINLEFINSPPVTQPRLETEYTYDNNWNLASASTGFYWFSQNGDQDLPQYTLQKRSTYSNYNTFRRPGLEIRITHHDDADSAEYLKYTYDNLGNRTLVELSKDSGATWKPLAENTFTQPLRNPSVYVMNILKGAFEGNPNFNQKDVDRYLPNQEKDYQYCSGTQSILNITNTHTPVLVNKQLISIIQEATTSDCASTSNFKAGKLHFTYLP